MFDIIPSELPIFVMNSEQFANNNQINLALDYAIIPFSFENGDGSRAFPLYFRVGIGNIKPWFYSNGTKTMAYYHDRYGKSKIIDWLYNHFPTLNYSISEIELHFNINNKKSCKFNVKLHPANNNYVLQMKEKEIKYSRWGKLTVPEGCISQKDVNKIMVVISASKIGENELVTQNSYQELYLDLTKRSWKDEENIITTGFIQYKNYDERNQLFDQTRNLFQNKMTIERNNFKGIEIESLFSIKFINSYDREDFVLYPIDILSKIDKLKLLFENRYLEIPTVTTILASQTKYHFIDIKGYLKYDYKNEKFNHYFYDQTIWNSQKNQIELITAKEEKRVLIANPFLATDWLTIETTIEFTSKKIEQTLISRQPHSEVKIDYEDQDSIVGPQKLINFQVIYLIINSRLTGYYNQDFTKQLFEKFVEEFYH